MPATAIVEAFSITHAQICDGVSGFLSQLSAAVNQSLDVYGVSDASMAADTGNYENTGDNNVLSRWNWLNFATVSVQGGYLSLPMYATLSGRPVTTTTVSALANEVQTMTSSGASAGNFTLSFRGQTTAPIAFGATAATVNTAFQLLSTVGTAITVTGGPANTTALVFTASGTLAGQPLDLITANLTGLTGVTGGVITRTTPGAGPLDTYYSMDLWHEDSMNVAARPLILVLPSKDSLGAIRRLVIGLYKVQFGPIGFDGPTYKDGLKVNYEGTALMSTTDETGVVFADGKRRIGTLLSVIG